MTETVRSCENTLPVQIRPYLPQDYAQIKSILEEAGMFDPIWDKERNLNSKIERNPNSILVASADNNVIGNVYIVEDGWEGFIFHLAVRQQYQGKGVGSKLIAEAEQLLRKKGVEEVALFVDSNKEDLFKYYTKRGYRDYGGEYKCLVKRLS